MKLKNEEFALSQIDKIIETKIKCCDFEPITQGAGGMRICRKDFFEKAVKKFRSAGIVIIFDEVMTVLEEQKMFATNI